jgi:hypothetical protein
MAGLGDASRQEIFCYKYNKKRGGLKKIQTVLFTFFKICGIIIAKQI